VFRQDRTNPSTKVSQWRGRSATPKAWPSTAVSSWQNGGLFGAAAGAGSPLEYISTFTVASTTSTSLEITGIPQTYRDIVLVWDYVRLQTYGIEGYWRPFTGAGAFASSRVNSGSPSTTTASSFFGDETSVGSKFTAMQTDAGEIAAGSSFMTNGETYFIDYSNAATNTLAESWLNPSTSRSGLQLVWSCCAFGQSGDGVGAMDTIRIQASTGTSSNYYFVSGTKFQLFGRGAAR